MSTSFQRHSNDSTQEELLRTTLQEHAEMVDLNSGRAAIEGRIASLKQNSKLSKISRFSLFHINGQQKKWNKPALFAAVALLSVLLMGAAFGGGVFWDHYTQGSLLQKIHDQHNYKSIGQGEQVGQITITVLWAYADLNNTLIAYDIQMPTSMEKQYNAVTLAAYSLTDQKGHEPNAANLECEAFPQDGSPMYCILRAPSFNPGTGITQITFKFVILGLYLIPPHPASKILVSGNWQFQFTVPFNRTKLAPPPSVLQQKHKP